MLCARVLEEGKHKYCEMNSFWLKQEVVFTDALIAPHHSWILFNSIAAPL